MKNISQQFILKSTSIAGIIGAGTISLASIITALFYVGQTNERYSPLNHFVSELGELGVSDIPYIFNYGLIVGALFLCVFLLGIAWLMRSWLSWFFAILALVTGISGLLVGVFPLNNLGPHIAVALTFFNIGQFTMLFFSVYVLFSKKPWFSKKLALPGFLTVSFFIIFLNLPSAIDESADFEHSMKTLFLNRPGIIPLAIAEWLVIMGVLLWVIITSIHLWKFYKSPDSPISEL